MSDRAGVISDCIITYYTTHRQGNGPNISILMQKVILARRDSLIGEIVMTGVGQRRDDTFTEVGYGLRSVVTLCFLPRVSARYQPDYQTNFPSEKLSRCWTGSKAGGSVHCPGGRKVGNCEILGQYFTLVVRPGRALV